MVARQFCPRVAPVVHVNIVDKDVHVTVDVDVVFGERDLTAAQ